MKLSTQTGLDAVGYLICAVQPPSTTRSVAVMNEAAGESRNAMALAISSGEPRRRSGVLFSMFARRSGDSTYRWSIIGVRMAPGQTVLQRIPSGPSCSARDRDSDTTAALLTW